MRKPCITAWVAIASTAMSAVAIAQADAPTHANDAAAHVRADGRAFLEAALRERYPNVSTVEVHAVGVSPRLAPDSSVERIDDGAPVLKSRIAVRFRATAAAHRARDAAGGDERRRASPSSTASPRVATVTQWFAVAAYGRAAVPVRAVKAGEVVHAVDLAERDVDLAPSGVASMPRIDAIAGRVARHALAEGMPIAVHALVDAPLVRRNSPVTVLIKTAALDIAARGIAQRDGRAGSCIPVRNDASGEIFDACVIGSDRVRAGEGASCDVRSLHC